MLIWHCTDFVRLLGSNLNDIKTAITGPSRFMCSLIQSKAPSCFGNGTHLFFPQYFIISFFCGNFCICHFQRKPCRLVLLLPAQRQTQTFFGLSVAT